jgi:hypothetical protein
MKASMIFLTLMPGFALADFQSDISSEELRAWTGEVLLGDLAVGESALVRLPFCWTAGKMYARADTTVIDAANTFSITYKLTRLPQGRVAAETLVGSELRGSLTEEKYEAQLKNTLAAFLTDNDNCNSPFRPPSTLLLVDNIDGANSSTELIKHFFPE